MKKIIISYRRYLFCISGPGLKVPGIITWVLLLLSLSVSTVFASSSYGQTTLLSIEMTERTLSEVIDAIENETGFNFFYNSKLIDMNRKVSVKVENKNVFVVLDQIFKNSDVDYKVVDKDIILTVKELPVVTQQNGRRITGKILDEVGDPVIGANVVVKGTSNGTITDLDGNFMLEGLPAQGILVVTYIGYTPREVAVGNQDTIQIQLSEDIHSLEEVVVIGYGVQKKKLVTGATVQVGGDDIQQQNRTEILGALQGQTPGVTIVQSSGMPGSDFKVNIRGVGTIAKSAPLYVIDGIPGGDINTLNPSDIETIDVLKDAASAAIYGARAANGVILVTTRQGKTGKVQLSYDGYYGFQNIAKKPKLLNARLYMEIVNEARANSGVELYDFAKEIPVQYALIQNGLWNGTNWLDEAENTNAPLQNHSINLMGGSEQSKFTVGLSYSNREGTLGKPVALKSERYTLRVNSDHVLLKSGDLDMIRIGENVTYSFRERTGIGIGDYYSNDLHNLLITSPLLPAYNNDGDFYLHADKVADQWNLDGAAANPLAIMVYNRGNNIRKNYSLSANGYVEIQPIKNLKYRTVFGYTMTAESYRTYTPEAQISSTVDVNDRVRQSMESGHKWSWENTVSYSHIFDKVHTMDVVVGTSAEKWGIGEKMDATNGDILFPGEFDYAWLANAPSITSGVTTVTGSPRTKGSLLSVFGRINYNYKEKYMLTVIMRGDGSSTFMSGNRWGYFPSVSAGWVATSEPFMAPVLDWMDFFKLRASWGQNGNQDVSDFQYLATILFDENSSYFFGNDKTTRYAGGYADVLPNEDITWETSEQLDFGFDARFLNSRLGLSFDWYSKKTKDWLVQAPVLLSYGTGAPYINGGDVENKGVEIGITWNDRINKDFRYGVNFNISHNKNKVTRIANSEGIIHGNENALFNGTKEAYRVEVGYPISYFYGFKTAGVFQNEQQIANTQAKYENAQPGDVIFVDTNHDGAITDDDRVMIGDPNPDYIMGFSVTLGYKGLDFLVTATGAFGHQILKSYRRWVDRPFDNYTDDIYGRWHGEGTSNKIPRLTASSHMNRQNISDLYIEDGDYVKIQTVTVGYDFKKLFPNMPLGQARVYVSAQNLFTITGYSGMDPEVGCGNQDWARGIDLGFYPSPRTYLVGVNLKF